MAWLHGGHRKAKATKKPLHKAKLHAHAKYAGLAHKHGTPLAHGAKTDPWKHKGQARGQG